MSELRDILEKLTKGKYSLDEAEAKLRVFNIVEVARLAKLDVCRDTRKGIPEVVYAQHKAIDDLLAIIEQGIQAKPIIILSQLSPPQQKALQDWLQEVDPDHNFIFEVYGDGAIAVIHAKDYAPKQTGGKIGIIAAGTSDRHVAEAARVMAEQMGCQVYMAHDVGVAGVHRLFPELAEMVDQGIDVLIVAAGMEGALPSVIAGITDIPIIAVPTSVGYGASLKGLTALLAMLNSCPGGVAVVNIDNGFGAGYMASLINHL